jgi:5-hydroxyisourate hydrolase
MTRAAITTHILDLEMGTPAAGVAVNLFYGDAPLAIAQGTTDSDGRIAQWNTGFELQAGYYRLQFNIGDWFAAQARACFYPKVQIDFKVEDTSQHFHVPLLLSAHGYSTYRGS